jgi:hypothetical protein
VQGATAEPYCDLGIRRWSVVPTSTNARTAAAKLLAIETDAPADREATSAPVASPPPHQQVRLLRAPAPDRNFLLHRYAIVISARHHHPVSYTVTLWCGCTIYVSCNPTTAIARSRIVETRGSACPVRRHETGTRLWLWELLPDSPLRAEPIEGGREGKNT